MRRLPKKPGPDRRRAERAGRRAETLAALFLRLKLYRIVAMRYKTPVGEIDIVARRGRMLVLVEVKQRAGSPMAHAQALEAVNTARIIAAAGWFQSAHPNYQGFDFRFDVISVAPGRWPYHLVNAFSA
jgi:putative endonuclease